jgi:hypothetical protein
MKPEVLTSKYFPSRLPCFEKYYPICFREGMGGVKRVRKESRFVVRVASDNTVQEITSASDGVTEGCHVNMSPPSFHWSP